MTPSPRHHNRTLTRVFVPSLRPEAYERHDMTFDETMRAIDYVFGYTVYDVAMTPIFVDLARNELTTEDLVP